MMQFDDLIGTSDYSSCHLFAKDRFGKYLIINQKLSDDLGFDKETDIVGLTDFDLAPLPERQALILRNNDNMIMENEYTKTFIEPVTLISGKEVIAISHKRPLRTNTKKVIGVTGVSLILDKDQYLSFNEHYFMHQHEEKFDLLQLTKRETEVLKQTLKGKTAKQIAKQLYLSERTVEHYLLMIKNKLNVRSKSELIGLFNN